MTIDTNTDELIRGTLARISIDKQHWLPGPWQAEPDTVHWIYRDNLCLIRRNPHTGILCGYVCVGEGHPLYNKSYDDDDAVPFIDVHGGLTFSDNICRLLELSEDIKLWAFGFDCAHLGDLPPCNSTFGINDHNATYKDVTFVRREVEKLCQQLVQIQVGVQHGQH